MSDADVVELPPPAAETADSPVAPPAAETVNDVAPVSDITTTNNEAGNDVIAVSDDSLAKSAQDADVSVKERQFDDLPSVGGKQSNLEVNSLRHSPFK